MYQQLNIKTSKPFKPVGAYFQLVTYQYQPVWCSYSLSDLIPLWEMSGGWIIDETGNILRFKIQTKYEHTNV
jgi:hypothetical protein